MAACRAYAETAITVWLDSMIGAQWYDAVCSLVFSRTATWWTKEPSDGQSMFSDGNPFEVNSQDRVRNVQSLDLDLDRNLYDLDLLLRR